MRSHDTVLNGLLKHVPLDRFDALSREHETKSRKFTPRQHLIALLHNQFSGAESLRAGVAGLRTHATRLYHAGGVPVPRSTLSEANATRPAEAFTTLFAEMAAQAQRGLRRKMALSEATYLIDATSIDLTSLSADWTKAHKTTYRGKVHIVHDMHAGIPVRAVVTPSKTGDISVAKAMPVERGATYVFDMGYYDFGWWATLVEHDCTIVTRFKRHTKLREGVERPLPSGSDALSDRVGFLPARMARSRKNPMQVPVREVVVQTETGTELRLLTNDLKASADEIAALYKRRWDIELFFRWIKQNLRIRKFHGTSRNAVRIQVAVALIAYLIVRIAHALQSAIPSTTAFLRTIRTTLMHRRAAEILGDRPSEQRQCLKQIPLNFSHGTAYA